MSEEIINFKIGEVIINELETSSDLYELVEGVIAVFNGTTKIAEIKQEGTLIGEMSFFLENKRSATLIAISKVKLKKYPKSEIKQYFKDNPEFAIKVATNLAQKLNKTTEKLSELQNYKNMFENLRYLSKCNDELRRTITSLEDSEKLKNEKIKEMLNTQSLMSKKIILPFIQENEKIIKDFLDCEVKIKEQFLYGNTEINMQAASVVNLMGGFKGWYMIAFPKESALKMASKMMDKKFTDFDEDVDNFLKEINNVIIGWIIGALKEYNLTISTPITIFGEKEIKNMIKKKQAVVVPFETDLGEIYTIMALELVE
jgi:CheY-specific phosphatase CheX/CRP-like cAMP-binding protein